MLSLGGKRSIQIVFHILLEWILGRYQFSKDKDRQIINDPKHIFSLLKRIITVSLAATRWRTGCRS